jgi:ComF family protein
MVNSLLEALTGGLFPQYCVLCGLRSDNPLPLCPDCRTCLQPNLVSCSRCALPLPPGTAPASQCGRCLQSPPAFSTVLAPWLYEEHLAYLIRRWKFNGATWLTPLLADLWLHHSPLPAPPELVIPVPLHWRRQWHRGYNQSLLLAREVHRNAAWSGQALLRPGLLARSRHTPAQSGLDRRQRAANMLLAFRLGRGARSRDRLAGRNIAIVDDVVTTGATCHAIASLLLDHGARSVQVWCLARTPPPGDEVP